jgi:hypothetical protein
MRITTFALCVVAIACSNSDDLPGPSRTEPIVESERQAGSETARPGPTRAEREAVREAELPVEAQEPAAGPDPRTSTAPARLSTRTIDVADAEDGRGHRVSAVRALALDVSRDEGWPARGHVPTLHVGQLQFHASETIDERTIRFIAADASALPRSATVFVQWGSDTRTRVMVSGSFAAPASELPMNGVQNGAPQLDTEEE